MTTVGIEKRTFNTGQNKYVAQFALHCEEVANYIQRTLADEGYLAQTIRTGTKQSILLPPPVDPNDTGVAFLHRGGRGGRVTPMQVGVDFYKIGNMAESE